MVDLKFIGLIIGLFNKGVNGQEIATIHLRDSVIVDRPENSRNYTGLGSSKVATQDTFTLNDCQIVFQDGFIKTIIATGTVNDSVVLFSNKFGIGITTRNNIRKLVKNHLYNEQNKGYTRSIRVGSLIRYLRTTGVRTSDYNPTDQSLILYSGQNSRTLYKTPRTKLFTLNIFSDFAGINQNNPNGLIQTELFKRINYWTQRSDFTKTSGIGMFTHVIPSFEISKTESNNRILPLSIGILNSSDTINYVSPLEIYRHSIAKTALEINGFDIEGSVSSIHVNAIIGAATSRINDTTIINSNVELFSTHINSIFAGAIVKFIFNPESSWSFQGSYRFIEFDALNDAVQIYSEEDKALVKPNKFINTAELLTTWRADNDNSIFGRFRFNHELNYSNNNFSEFQLGYSIYLKSSQQ